MSKISPPLPGPAHIARFKRLISETRGVELSDQEAYKQCCDLVRYIYLVECVLPVVRKTKEEKDGHSKAA